LPANEARPVALQTAAYIRNVQDLRLRVSLQDLTAAQFKTASQSYTMGNPSPMGDLVDAMLSTDPEIRAALKQLKTAVAGVEFVVTAPNDSAMAIKIANDLRTDLKNPMLNLRALKGWVVEGRVRGVGLVEAIWNDPVNPHRKWERFEAIPQQRTRLNKYTGEAQFAESAYIYQGTDVSAYDKGKWLVIQPDLHVRDFGLRGIAQSLVNDWYGRVDVMGWWAMCLERDAMHTLVGKAASDRDAVALDLAFKNRGAAGSFLIRDEKSSVTQLEATMARSGISPYGEYMTHTAQRMFLALLGESQTGIIEKLAGSKQSAATQHTIARYVVEDLCNDVAFIMGRDAFAPWVEVNYGAENLVNTPSWTPVFLEAVDIVALNSAIATRPANVELGPTWYRQQTQWPAPLPGETPLSAPLPPPGSKPLGAGESETPGPGEKKNDSEKPGAQGEAAA
jgi:Protein of unknown function (DUF935)